MESHQQGEEYIYDRDVIVSLSCNSLTGLSVMQCSILVGLTGLTGFTLFLDQ